MASVLSIWIIIESISVDAMIHLSITVMVKDGTDGPIDRELKFK